MFVASVTGVDHRHTGVFCHGLHRPVPMVPHHQHIRIAGNNLSRVGNRFALGG